VSKTKNAIPVRTLYSSEYYFNLLAGLIHKLNNVTTVLSGHSGLILMDEKLSDEIRDPVENMAKATQVLSLLVDEAAIVAKATPHHFETVHFESLLQECAVPANLQVIAKNPPIAEAIEADPVKLRQILEEILRNAAAAGATQVAYQTEELDDSYILRFRDNGRGIKKEIMSRVFDPFFTTRKLTEAFGLGLFRARGELARINGEILATSDGSTFTEILIKIPKHPPGH
jgi:signal transduction histidine kinase